MQNINSSTLSNLYEFRVTNGLGVVSMQPNRRRAARQFASWVKQGHRPDSITAERKVNGQWQNDNETHALARKYAEKEISAAKPNGSATKKEPTFSDALRGLKAAVTVCLQSSQITSDHLGALDDAISRVRSFMGYGTTEEQELTAEVGEDSEETEEANV